MASALEQAGTDAFLLRRQNDPGSCSNGTFTAPNGLGFNITCYADFVGSNLVNKPGTDIDDCATQCSALQPLCYGTDFDGTSCWFMNSKDDQTTLYSRNITHVALANLTQLTPLDSHCPFSNMSNQTTSVGYQFQIDCGKDYPGSDIQNSPVHRESLEDCMETCAGWHDLCKAVAFNPDMTDGYQNCYLKTSNDPAGVSDVQKDQVALGITPFVTSYNRTCSANATQTFKNETSGMEKAFQLNCGSNRVGSDITQTREGNFDSCIDTCANYWNTSISNGPTCQAVAYNAASDMGYLNCWLKGSQQALSPDNRLDSAVIVDTVSSGTPSPSPTPPASNPPPSHSSKAWIAGPVIGVIAAFAIGAAVAWWCRGRGNRYKRPPEEDIPVKTPEPTTYTPPPPVEADGTELKYEADSDHQILELGGASARSGPGYP